MKLVNDLKSLHDKIKQDKPSPTGSTTTSYGNRGNPDFKSPTDPDASPQDMLSVGDGQIALGGGGLNQLRKKRRKPLAGNEKDRRPMNGFMLFAKSMRVELTKEFPGKDNRYLVSFLIS